MPNTVIIIPARYESTRFPGKPLTPIAGKSMIQRVWEIASAVKKIDGVYVATDDDRIADHVIGFGGKVIMTDTDLPNGTERCFAAANTLKTRPEIIINLQGDAPVTPPSVVQEVVNGLQKNPHWGMATPAVQLSWKARDELIASKKITPGSGTTVVFDKDNRALYFSKEVLPHVRKPEGAISPTYRHIGLYGYRYDTLKKYVSLPESPLEQVEKLEQLRMLYHGEPVYVVPVKDTGRAHASVDSPEDVARVEHIIKTEGELCS